MMKLIHGFYNMDANLQISPERCEDFASGGVHVSV